ncbi:dicarboxylate/amino acid:cation symporter [Enterocloster asparagiformis]|nr:dicarboxylate/amino acid:cation symporter [Enterocloster asparagiformis]
MAAQTTKIKSSYREPIILIAFVILGAIIGLVLGEKAAFLYPVGQIWLNMLFVLLVPLIFFSISSSIANIGDTSRVGKMLGLTIGIFIATAGLAGIYMFIVTGIFGVDTSVQMGNAETAIETAAASVGDQIVSTFTVGDFSEVISRNHILALIVFTIFFGITVSTLGEKGRAVASWLNDMSLVFYKMVALLMKLAPIGLMAYFANLTGIYGPDLLKSYGRGLLIYYPAAILYFFVFLGLYAFIAAGSWGVKNFFKNILTPALTALGTRSSAASLPLQMDACDKLGVPRDVSSVVVPVGATCHMDGACIATIYEIVLCCTLFGHPLNSIGDYALRSSSRCAVPWRFRPCPAEARPWRR